MRIFLLSLLLLCTIQTAHAEEPIFLIEIFTYPGCQPEEVKEIYNEDGTPKKPNDLNKKFKQTHVASTFERIIKEHPNAIALHYFNDFGYHTHDENGNDIESHTISKELSYFSIEQSTIHYSNQTFLQDNITPQMIINNTYATDGTMKHVADAAIARSQAEHSIAPIKMAINGQNLELEFPETTVEREIERFLVGYKQKQSYNKNLPAITPINIATSFQKLGSWDGKKLNQTISISEMDADGFALIVQGKYTRKVYAAGKVERPLTNQNQQ